jgi:hypothetical protein
MLSKVVDDARRVGTASHVNFDRHDSSPNKPQTSPILLYRLPFGSALSALVLGLIGTLARLKLLECLVNGRWVLQQASAIRR